VSAFLGLVFSLISNSQQEYYVMHILLWLSQTTGPIVILVYSHILLHKLSWFDRKSPWLKLFISGVVGSFLFSPFALGLDLLWGNDPFPETSQQLQGLWLDEILGILPPISLSWVAINAPWLLGFGFIRPDYSSIPNEQEARNLSISVTNSVGTENKRTSVSDDVNQLTFVALLNPEIGTDIVYLKSELHYLKVVTTKGKMLILYNLRDAIDEMPHGQGEQTHRSYWVNYSHITKMRLNGRQGVLLLTNDEEIPVSRNNIKLFSDFKTSANS